MSRTMCFVLLQPLHVLIAVRWSMRRRLWVQHP
jgi:hypothetical protein